MRLRSPLPATNALKFRLPDMIAERFHAHLNPSMCGPSPAQTLDSCGCQVPSSEPKLNVNLIQAGAFLF